VGLQVGLSQNMVSNTAMRQILLSSNVTPPTPSPMQKQANKVGAAIESLNILDMQRQREKLQAVQHLRGQAGKPIPVEGDARYNNNLTSGGGKTPYQPATQTVYTLAENVTKEKKKLLVYTQEISCVTRPKSYRARREMQHVQPMSNNGIKNSTLAKMKHLGIEPTTSVVKELERMEKKQKLRLECKKTVAYRRRLKVRIISRYRKYDRSKAAKLCSHYKKGITMASLNFGEHSYCKRKYRN